MFVGKNARKYTIYALIWFSIHIFMRCDYLDDVLKEGHIIHYLWEIPRIVGNGYLQWNPRIFCSTVMHILLNCPWWIWKIFDVAVILLLVYTIDTLCNTPQNGRNLKQAKISCVFRGKVDCRNEGLIFTMALVLCYPFCHQGSTGWISTTTNHLWPLTFGLYCIAVIVNSLKSGQEKPNYLLFILAMCYAANQIAIDGILILCFIMALMSDFIISNRQKKKTAICRNKKYRKLMIMAGACIVLDTVIYLACPGNAVRNAADIAWIPDWAMMNLWGKIRLGFCAIFAHMVSIPNALFFILCSILALGIFKTTDNRIKRGIGILPLLLDVIWTSYFTIIILLGKRDLDYYIPKAVIKSDKEMILQILLGLSYCVVLICFVLALGGGNN